MKANCTRKSSHKYSLLCPYRGSKPTFLVQIPDWVPGPCSSGHLVCPLLWPSNFCSLFKPFLPLVLAHWGLYTTCPYSAVPRSTLQIVSRILLQKQAIETSLWPWARDTVLSSLDNSGPLCCLNFQTFLAVFIWLHAWNVHRGQWFSTVAVHWNRVGNLEK